MSSQIDPSVIRDDQKVAKSDVREQFQIAKDEITDLQRKTRLPWLMAMDDARFDNL